MKINNTFTFSPVLDKTTLDRMHASALEMIARTGFRVQLPEMQAEALKLPGFTEKNGRLCIAPERVQDWMKAAQASRAKTAPADPVTDFVFSVGDRAYWILDRDGTSMRQMTRDDVIVGTKLIEMLRPRGARGTTCGVPSDVPVPLQPLEQYMIAAEYSSAGGGTPQVCDIRTAQIVREMDKVYGRPFHQSVYLIGPLGITGSELEILWHFRHEVDGVLVGSMPIMGLTAPCDMLSTFTLAIAEVLGGAALFHALLPSAMITILPHPEPADLRTGAIVFGTPEWQLLDLMHREIMDYYGMSWNVKLSLTTASLPNAQAQIERTTSALLAILGGFHGIGPLGQLGLDEVWSPVQLLLDMEMLEYAARIARGPEPGEALALTTLPDLVDEVVTNGQLFAEHETTVMNYRAQYQQPELLQRMGRAQWLAAGRPDVLETAQRRVDELVAAYNYEAPQAIMRELRKIYAWGKSLQL